MIYNTASRYHTSTRGRGKRFTEKTNDLENRSRRKNLVFYGVDDKASEIWDEFEAMIKNICKTSLGMELEYVKGYTAEDAITRIISD